MLNDKLSGEETNYTGYALAYKLMQVVSGISGVPIAAAMRELSAAWNLTVGAMAPSLKVKTYDPGDKNSIKYAYQDGYLSEADATDELMRLGLVEDEDEAYWLMQEWADPEGDYSRFDSLDTAVRSGGDVSEAMAELTDHGYTEKDVRSHIRSAAGAWYVNGEITRDDAKTILTSYGGYDSDKAEKTISEWSAEADTGIAYGDIDEAYVSGDISESEAARMYQKYGGLTEDEAESKLSVAAFKNEHPELDWDAAAIAKYNSEVKSSGITVTVYDEYLTGRKQCKGTDLNGDGKTDSGSVKSEALLVINSLPISSEQKDVLYRLNGWSERTISEAPWH